MLEFLKFHFYVPFFHFELRVISSIYKCVSHLIASSAVSSELQAYILRYLLDMSNEYFKGIIHLHTQN